MKKTFTGTVKEIIQSLFELEQDKKYSIEIKQFRKKRSNDANSYAWKLITELGNYYKISKEKCYEDMLKHYGQVLLVPIKAGDNPNGYFKYYDYECSKIINGKEADYYRVYKGSSEYDTHEMSVFIDGVIQECQDVGIETLPPQELALLKEEWQ